MKVEIEEACKPGAHMFGAPVEVLLPCAVSRADACFNATSHRVHQALDSLRGEVGTPWQHGCCSA